MTTKAQADLWGAIQRDAKAANLSDGEYLAKFPARYEAYQRAGKPPTDAVARNAAVDRRISDEARELAAAKGVTEGQALVELFSKTSEGRDRYADLRRPKGQAGDDTGPKSLTPDEMVALSRLARKLDYDLPISEIAGLGAGFARDLWANLQEEADDYQSHNEGDDETVRFAEFGPEVSFDNLDWRPD